MLGNCHYYVDADGTSLAREFICGLDRGDQIEFFARIKSLVKNSDLDDVERFGELLVITWSDIYVFLYQPTDADIVVLYGTKTSQLSVQRAAFTAQRFLELDRASIPGVLENA